MLWYLITHEGLYAFKQRNQTKETKSKIDMQV